MKRLALAGLFLVVVSCHAESKAQDFEAFCDTRSLNGNSWLIDLVCFEVQDRT